jgi:hypothetical protein
MLLYAIESHRGHIIAHSSKGTLLFGNADCGKAFIDKLDKGVNRDTRHTLSQLDLDRASPDPLRYAPGEQMDELSQDMPKGAVWMQDFREGVRPTVPVDEPELPAPVTPQKRELDALRAQCDELGIPYNGRWGVDRLRTALANPDRSEALPSA